MIALLMLIKTQKIFSHPTISDLINTSSIQEFAGITFAEHFDELAILELVPDGPV